MPFKDGNTEGKGRPKGAPNKITKKFKDLLTETYEALEDNSKNKKEDAETGLLVWAKDNPTDFYRICSKLLPIQLTGKDGDSLFGAMSDSQVENLVARIKTSDKL